MANWCSTGKPFTWAKWGVTMSLFVLYSLAFGYLETPQTLHAKGKSQTTNRPCSTPAQGNRALFGSKMDHLRHFRKVKIRRVSRGFDIESHITSAGLDTFQLRQLQPPTSCSLSFQQQKGFTQFRVDLFPVLRELELLHR